MKLNEYVKPDKRFAIYESVRNDCDPKTAAYLTEMHNGFVLPFLKHLDRYLYEAAITADQSKQLWADLQASGAPGGKSAAAPAAETPLDPKQAEQFAKKLPDAEQSAPVEGFKEKALKIIGSVKDAVAQKSLKQLAQDAIKNPTMQTLALTALSGMAGVAAAAATGGSAPLVGGIVGGLMGVTRAKMQGQDWKSAAQSGLKGAAIGAAAGFVGGTAASMMSTGLQAAADQVKGATAPQQAQQQPTSDMFGNPTNDVAHKNALKYAQGSGTPQDMWGNPVGGAAQQQALARAGTDVFGNPNPGTTSMSSDPFNGPKSVPDASKLPGGDTGMKDAEVRSANMQNVSNNMEKNAPSPQAAASTTPAPSDENPSPRPRAAASTTPAPSDENPSPRPRSAGKTTTAADPYSDDQVVGDPKAKLKAITDDMAEKMGLPPGNHKAKFSRGVPVEIDGKPVPPELLTPEQQRLAKSGKDIVANSQAAAKEIASSQSKMQADMAALQAAASGMSRSATSNPSKFESRSNAAKRLSLTYQIIKEAGEVSASTEEFIKAALSQGYSKEQIQGVLKKNKFDDVVDDAGAAAATPPAAAAPAVTPPPSGSKPGTTTPAGTPPANAAAAAKTGAPGKAPAGTPPANAATKGSGASSVDTGEEELDKETVNKIFMNIAQAVDDDPQGSGQTQGGQTQGGQTQGGQTQGGQVQGGQTQGGQTQGGQTQGGQTQGGGQSQGGGQTQGGGQAAPAASGGGYTGPDVPLDKAAINKILMAVAQAGA